MSGFLSFAARQGCSRCKKVFPGGFGEKRDYSNFEQCEKRTNEEHRREAQETLNQTSAKDRQQVESKYGTRYSELMRLPYFDCVRFTIIDPMHNLFLGTAKHLMENIWLNESNPLLSDTQLKRMQQRVDDVEFPSTLGRLPNKIAISFGGFTADQWKTWTLIISLYALKGDLPEGHLKVWRSFVLACKILCCPFITTADVMKANVLLKKFCVDFEQLYGKERVTPNMHMHTHLCECVLDFGPIYAFWLFSFERYNGIMGAFPTNNRSIEIQLTRKFLRDQSAFGVNLPDAFRDEFQPLLVSLRGGQAGTLGEMEREPEESFRRLASLCNGPVLKSSIWTEISLYSCLPPSCLDNLESHEVHYLRKMYKIISENVEEESILGNFERFSAVEIGGERYGSSASRSARSSFILASWVSNGGRVNINSSELRPGQVSFYMRQNVLVDGEYQAFLLAYVLWFQTHPEKDYFGQPLQVCCKDLFEQLGPATFIPIQRIQCKFVPVIDKVKRENVMIVCPIARKISISEQ